jgi:cobalt-zinc-cadmium efflux system membrane fusion protein
MTAADLERVSKALELKERPENNKGCQFYRRRLQFISVDAMERAGVDIDVAQVRAMIETIDTPAETMYNPSRMARATARVSGTIWRVERDLGEPVRRGDVLAVIDSADVGRAKADFFQALAQVESKSKLLENLRQAGDVVRRREIAEAEAALREARIRLLSAQQALANLGLAARWEDLFGLADELLAERVRSLGLPESLVKAMDGKLTSANLLPVTAPLDGVIVQRQAVAGEPADPESTLFVVSDVQQKWLRLSVRPDDVRLIHVGQEVRFRPDGARLEFKGTVRWISTAVDETTRTVEARAELADPDSRLRAGTFGIGRIVIRDEPKAVVVPNQAIHWDGSCHVVFVRDVHFLREGAPKVFHTRTVRPGTRSDEFTEILAGIAPLEVVAAKGSAVLRAALLKNSLGAG